MPTKKRREDAEKRRKQREEDERAWAEFDATCAQLSPEEQAARVVWAATTADEWEWGCPEYRNVGLTIDEKTGELCMHPDHGQGANRDREKIAALEARRMALEWGRKNMWGKREWTAHIAKQERVSERTIQRYYKLTAK